jgi:hypothetical protein
MVISDIFKSKTESIVLSFFLAAPPRSFSIFEISKRLRLPFFKASFSLNKLAQNGVLKSFSKKGKKYFFINAKSPFFAELNSFAKKKGPKYSDELFSAVRRLGKLKAAFLSGIFTGYSYLPVDILLVGKVNLKKLDAFLKSANKLMGQEINYSIMTPKEFVLRRDTFDKFIKDIFDYRHIAVVDQLKNK